MSTPIIVGEEARAELLEAFRWYAQRSKRAARGFLSDFRGCRDRLRQAPDRWPVIDSGCRRILFKKYPYSLVYSIEPDVLFIVAVMHQRRSPGYWRTRL